MSEEPTVEPTEASPPQVEQVAEGESRPDYLQERFMSEGMSVNDGLAAQAKAFTELEKNSRVRVERLVETEPSILETLGYSKTPPPSATPEAAILSNMTGSIPEMLESTGLDGGKLIEEFNANNGALSEDSYAAFAKAGMGKPMVDLVTRGMRDHVSEEAGKVTAKTSRMEEIAGGKEELEALLQYGGNLGNSTATRAGLDSPHFEAVLKDLKNTRQVDTGISTGALAGVAAAGKVPTVEPFKDNHEVGMAYNDERFRNTRHPEHAQFKATVMARVAAGKKKR